MAGERSLRNSETKPNSNLSIDRPIAPASGYILYTQKLINKQEQNIHTHPNKSKLSKSAQRLNNYHAQIEFILWESGILELQKSGLLPLEFDLQGKGIQGHLPYYYPVHDRWHWWSWQTLWALHNPYSMRQGQRMDCPHKESRHYTWLKICSQPLIFIVLSENFSLKVERDEFIK